MSQICHIQCKNDVFDYDIKRLSLCNDTEYLFKLYFQISQQNEFTYPETIQYDKSILNLFFSELEKLSRNEMSQIDTISNFSESILQQLFELSEIFKTPNVKIKIYNKMKENGTINYWIKECEEKKGKKGTKEEEKLISEKLTKPRLLVFNTFLYK